MMPRRGPTTFSLRDALPILGYVALRRDGARFREGHALRLRRGVLLHPVDVLRDRIDRRGTVGVAATLDRGADRIAAFHADAPFRSEERRVGKEGRTQESPDE